MLDSLHGRRIVVAACAAEGVVGGAPVEGGDAAVGVDDVANVLERGEFDVAVAEGDVGAAVVARIGSGAVFGGALLWVGVVGKIGQARRVQGPAVVAPVVEVLDGVGVGYAAV